MAFSARAEAKISGAVTFIGRPHAPCGQTERYTKRGRCVRCTLAQNAERARKNLDRDRSKHQERNAKWIKANKSRMRGLQTKWRIANARKAQESTKKWAEADPERARSSRTKTYQKYAPQRRLEHRLWAAQNREHVRAYNARRKADKIKRTPPYANLKLIEQFYADCPVGFHVDHVIPLRGKLVSGFHIETNLQYLSEPENQSKHNRFRPIFTSEPQGE